MSKELAMSHEEHEYLTFNVANEEYGVDILCVQEIRVLQQLTELPNKPSYIRGVINLRGTIIPIVDLRTRFNKPEVDHGDKTVVIILKEQSPNSPGCLGIIVDMVSEVYNFSSAEINEAPAFGSQIDHCFIHGLASVDNKLIVLLDTSQLLDIEILYQHTSEPVTEIQHEKDVV